MYIGIDGGGTKTKVALADKDLNVLAETTQGPSSIRTVPFEESMATLRKGIEACLEKIPDAKVESLFAGLGDVAGDADGQMVADRLQAFPFLKDARIEVKNDVYNAHAGALEGRSGIVVIIGTGSVAFGRDEEGETHRAGGYSHHEGDLGSAFGLGKQALSVMGKALDGRAEESPLTKDLIKHFGIESFLDAVKVYNEFTNRTGIASLAPLVTKRASEGDKNALAIIETAADELLCMVKAVDAALHLENKEIAIVGSLGNAPTPHRDRFLEKVKAYDPSFVIHEAKQSAVHGALVLARRNPKT